MNDKERVSIERTLRTVIDDAEHASNCGRTSVCNLYDPIQYALSDARLALKALRNAEQAAARAVDLLLAIRDREEN
jgi:hypothetical protein